MMQPQPARNTPAQVIPTHVAERLESEWKQIREAQSTNQPKR